jgi:hypothetical protein
MPAGSYIDNGKSAMAKSNPMLDLLCLTGSLMNLNAGSAILGQ